MPSDTERTLELSTLGPRVELAGRYDITQFRRVIGAIRQRIDRGYQDLILDFFIDPTVKLLIEKAIIQRMAANK
jgi:hypothetical protein